MIFQIQKPTGVLNTLISSIIYHKGYNPAHTIERLISDGSVNIIIDLTDEPKYIFDNDSLTKKERYKKYWVSGMQDSYISISSGANSEMMVISFKPGGAYCLFDQPVSELNNLVVDADLIFGGEIEDVREVLLEAQTIEAKFGVIEGFLKMKAKFDSQTWNFVERAVHSISTINSQKKLVEVVADSGYSQKQFIHLFKRYIGQTPKSFQKMVRFNEVLKKVHNKENVNWTASAYDLGYFDQAHFIKEFKYFSGLNPQKYLEMQGEYMNYIPIN